MVNETVIYEPFDNKSPDSELLCSEDKLCLPLYWQLAIYIVHSFGCTVNILSLLVLLQFEIHSNFWFLMIAQCTNDFLYLLIGAILVLCPLQMTFLRFPDLMPLLRAINFSTAMNTFVITWFGILDRYLAICHSFFYKEFFIVQHWKSFIPSVNGLIFCLALITSYIYPKRYCVAGAQPKAWRGDKSNHIVSISKLLVLLGLLGSGVIMFYKVHNELKRLAFNAKRMTGLRSQDHKDVYQVTAAMTRIITVCSVLLVPFVSMSVLQSYIPLLQHFIIQQIVQRLCPMTAIVNILAFIYGNRPYYGALRKLCSFSFKLLRKTGLSISSNKVGNSTLTDLENHGQA